MPDWPQNWPSIQDLERGTPFICLESVCQPTTDDITSMPTLQSKADWKARMHEPMSMLVQALYSKGISFPYCEMCTNQHHMEHITAPTHYKRMWEIAQKHAAAPYAIARQHFKQIILFNDGGLIFNHMDGEVQIFRGRDTADKLHSVPEPLENTCVRPPPPPPPPSQCGLPKMSLQGVAGRPLSHPGSDPDALPQMKPSEDTEHTDRAHDDFQENMRHISLIGQQASKYVEGLHVKIQNLQRDNLNFQQREQAFQQREQALGEEQQRLKNRIQELEVQLHQASQREQHLPQYVHIEQSAHHAPSLHEARGFEIGDEVVGVPPGWGEEYDGTVIERLSDDRVNVRWCEDATTNVMKECELRRRTAQPSQTSLHEVEWI